MSTRNGPPPATAAPHGRSAASHTSSAPGSVPGTEGLEWIHCNACHRDPWTSSRLAPPATGPAAGNPLTAFHVVSGCGHLLCHDCLAACPQQQHDPDTGAVVVPCPVCHAAPAPVLPVLVPGTNQLADDVAPYFRPVADQLSTALDAYRFQLYNATSLMRYLRGRLTRYQDLLNRARHDLIQSRQVKSECARLQEENAQLRQQVATLQQAAVGATPHRSGPPLPPQAPPPPSRAAPPPTTLFRRPSTMRPTTSASHPGHWPSSLSPYVLPSPLQAAGPAPPPPMPATSRAQWTNEYGRPPQPPPPAMGMMQDGGGAGSGAADSFSLQSSTTTVHGAGGAGAVPTVPPGTSRMSRASTMTTARVREVVVPATRSGRRPYAAPE
ncbi:hypothetical protein AMAG_01151 [Allomyces macrogynus ATCC 38327]|uniref:RING-type domain-containing protein n=1 Tax=Allomyces macrogynus (strain ATCC 38327) TaxID=578462 RepID=A0A0L0RY01_ALLM3|nr:hypothetical protein AMAG_01151 [Allomyces macrogynus ATCC 38327]|eukprot:KNE55238.1 hypothetical protein AMAG_01151 [Allomyces macrogynus ATCC 38327]